MHSALQMLFRAILVLHSCGLIEALTLQQHEESACTNSKLQDAYSAIESKAWDALRSNPCIADNLEEVDALEHGWEDPEDVGEWLPKPQSNELKLERSCQQKLLPSFLLIGYGHSGSTALAQQLRMHPELSYGEVKEHRFHMDARTTNANRNAYLNEFHVGCNVKQTFDASIGYHSRKQGFIKPFVEMVGNKTKILVMFRDPITFLNSIQSNYGKDAVESKLRLGKTCYAEELSRWVEFVPLENWLFLKSEDFFYDNQKTMDRVLDWIGVSPKKYNKDQVKRAANSGRRRSPPHKLSAASVKSYTQNKVNLDCAQRLEKMTNVTLDWPWYKEAMGKK